MRFGETEMRRNGSCSLILFGERAPATRARELRGALPCAVGPVRSKAPGIWAVVTDGRCYRRRVSRGWVRRGAIAGIVEAVSRLGFRSLPIVVDFNTPQVIDLLAKACGSVRTWVRVPRR